MSDAYERDGEKIQVGEWQREEFEAHGWKRVGAKPEPKPKPIAKESADDDLSLVDVLSSWLPKYASCGITTVQQLASMSVAKIDALKIERLGKTRAAIHKQACVDYIASKGA